MRTQFYITLPSNSSMQTFPDNKTCCFTTQLPRTIDLSGEWEVAIVEIQYPLTYLKNIIKTPPEIPKKESRFSTVIKDPPVNNATETLRKNLVASPIVNRQAVTVPQVVGGKKVNVTAVVSHIVQPCPKTEESIRETTTSLMSVYCDIIVPRIVGDVYAPLLRVLQLRQNGEYGHTEVKTFSPAHYFPLLLSSFRTIEISIRDDQGRAIPFDHGTLTVTLHLRPIH